jgi:hypothetical protein
MARIKAFPYILPQNEHIRTIEWLQRVGDEDIPLQEILPHWDPGMALQVSVKVEAKVDGIRSDCRLAPDDSLRAVVVWHSLGTNLRGCGSYVELNGTHSSLPLNLTLTLPGELLADRVRVEAQLILAGPGKSSFQLSPRHPGSILWREEKMIILEGLGSRFPIELIDFAESSWLPENASWFLDWDDSDLEQMALRSMRLFLNARNVRVRRAVAESLSIDEAIREIIQFDVGRTMIIGALENEMFAQNPDYSYVDGSVGSYARRLIRTLFPNENWEGIIHLYRQNRSRFECELQDRFRLFQGI